MQPRTPTRRLLALLFALQLVWSGVAGAQSPSPFQQAPAPARKISGADQRKAKAIFERGEQSENALDWPAAFEAYKEAVAIIPTNPTYLMRREVMRFRLVQEHTDHAERYAVAGNLAEARKELEAALALDPAYSVARERLAQFQDPPAQQPAALPPQLASAPAEIRPQPGTRDFDLRGVDAQAAYRDIARQFGVVATFDPDLPSRPVRFRAKEADFATAMKLLGEQTATFWHALDSHTFFVAADTIAKRRDFDPQITQRISLANSYSNDQMNETLRLVREIAGISHTELNVASRTLTLRDTPQKVAVAMAMLRELEQMPGEVMLEIEILVLDSKIARKLGITPPSSARAIAISPSDIRQFQQSTTSQQLLQIAQRLFGAAALAGAGGAFPPLIAFGGGKTTFLATLPGAHADFSDTLNVVRSGRRMLLRALDASPATFFIGERFPVSLALLSSSLNPTGFTPTISSSQFPILNGGVFPRTDFPVGKGPDAVVAGDFDGDSKLDVAAANATDNTVSILLGKGDGAFSNQTTFPVGNAPAALVARDFNGDGKLDLAVVNKNSNTLSIFLGNGDGTFGAGTDFVTGASPVAIAAGDFNADGFVDLAVVNQADNTVSIFLGKGNGTFFPRIDAPTGIGPVAVATGDFNGDAKLDLVVANQIDNTISILLGQGDGTFFSKTDLAVPGGPNSVAVADLNNDTHADIVVTSATTNTFTLFLGTGTGTFNSQITLATGSGPSAVVAANFGLRGFVDVVVANQTANTISVYPGNGDGSFQNRIDLLSAAGPVAMVSADLTTSNRLDLIVANQTANSVSVVLNSSAIASLATSPQSAYPASDYIDLGLRVTATPRVHPGQEVTLQLKFEIRDLAGVSFNGIPVISNRTIEQAVRLKEGESSVISGIIDREETQAIAGTPGLAAAPGVGYVFGRRDTSKGDTELLIILTPVRVRLSPRLDHSVYAGKGGTAGVP
jgi:tetratricopeptide (TPR) repeat protein